MEAEGQVLIAVVAEEVASIEVVVVVEVSVSIYSL